MLARTLTGNGTSIFLIKALQLFTYLYESVWKLRWYLFRVAGALNREIPFSVCECVSV